MDGNRILLNDRMNDCLDCLGKYCCSNSHSSQISWNASFVLSLNQQGIIVLNITGLRLSDNFACFLPPARHWQKLHGKVDFRLCIYILDTEIFDAAFHYKIAQVQLLYWSD